MKEFWNERYGQPVYVYGKAPNPYFAEQLKKLEKGKLLLPAEGEGRNAVYAAIKGWQVQAFDYSEVGREKARQLADSYEVDFDYQLVKGSEFKTSDKFDAVALIYAHFEGEERKMLFAELENALSPQGHLIVEVYSKNQLGKDSGGPKAVDLLYSKDEIKALFPHVDFLILEEAKVYLDQGSLHQGEAAVIRAVGVKNV